VAANLPIDGVHMFLDSLRRNLGNKLKGVERNVLPRTVTAHLTVGEVYGKNSAGSAAVRPRRERNEKMCCQKPALCLGEVAERALHRPCEPRTWVCPSRTPLMQAPLRWQRVSFRSRDAKIM